MRRPLNHDEVTQRLRAMSPWVRRPALIVGLVIVPWAFLRELVIGIGRAFRNATYEARIELACFREWW